MVTGRFCSREAARVATMQDPSGARHSAEPHVLISLEGLSGSGKTTQGRLLRQSLSTHGYQVAYLPDLATLGTDELGDALFDLISSSGEDRKSTRLNSSHVAISYAVFSLKKK